MKCFSIYSLEINKEIFNYKQTLNSYDNILLKDSLNLLNNTIVSLDIYENERVPIDFKNGVKGYCIRYVDSIYTSIVISNMR